MRGPRRLSVSLAGHEEEIIKKIILMLPGTLIGAVIGVVLGNLLITVLGSGMSLNSFIRLQQYSWFVWVFLGGYVGWKLQEAVLAVLRPSRELADTGEAAKKPWGRVIVFGSIAAIAIGILCVFIYFALNMFGGMFGKKQEPRFVEEPEATNLISQMTGVLLINQGPDSASPDQPRIISITFPSLTQRVVRRSKNDIIRAISGPDKQGRVAFVIESRFAENRESAWHRLNLINVDGTDEKIVFERPGDIQFSDTKPLGEHIALSPVGGLVALIGPISHQQNPGAYLSMGPIEIWDIAKSTAYKTNLMALDEQLSWLPNGKELVFSTLVQRDSIPNGETLPDDPYEQTQGTKSGRWERYPIILAFNPITKETRQLMPGHAPLLSADGKKLWASSGPQSWLMDLESKDSKPQTFPSWWGQPLLLPADGKAFFRAPPSKGTPPKWLQYGSFSVGTQMWAIKLGELGSWRFQTVLPYSDFRDEMSYGQDAIRLHE